MACLMKKVTSETLPHIFDFPTIFLDDVIYDMIFPVNNYFMLTLDDVDIEELYFCQLLESIVKQNIK